MSSLAVTVEISHRVPQGVTRPSPILTVESSYWVSTAKFHSTSGRERAPEEAERKLRHRWSPNALRKAEAGILQSHQKRRERGAESV